MIGWMSRTATRKPFHSPQRSPTPSAIRRTTKCGSPGMNPPGDHRADDGDDRADRKIDALGADHHRHAERDDRGRRGAIEDVDQVAEQPAFDDADSEEAGRDRRRRRRGSAPSARSGQTARCPRTARRRTKPRGLISSAGARSIVRARRHDRAPAIVRMMVSRVMSRPSRSRRSSAGRAARRPGR